MNRPDITKRALWDIDWEAIDWDAHVRFILIRIFQRGTIDDVKKLIAFYGKKKIVDELTSAETLPESVYYLVKTIFNIDHSKFKCSITKP